MLLITLLLFALLLTMLLITLLLAAFLPLRLLAILTLAILTFTILTFAILTLCPLAFLSLRLLALALLGFGGGFGGIKGLLHRLDHVAEAVGVLLELVVLGTHLLLGVVQLLLRLRKSILDILHVALGSIHVAVLHLLRCVARGFRGLLRHLGRFFRTLRCPVFVHLLRTGLLLDLLCQFVGFAREV